MSCIPEYVLERAKKLADLEAAVVSARMDVRRLELGGTFRRSNAQHLDSSIATAKAELAAAEAAWKAEAKDDEERPAPGSAWHAKLPAGVRVVPVTHADQQNQQLQLPDGAGVATAADHQPAILARAAAAAAEGVDDDASDEPAQDSATAEAGTYIRLKADQQQRQVQHHQPARGRRGACYG